MLKKIFLIISIVVTTLYSSDVVDEKTEIYNSLQKEF